MVTGCTKATLNNLQLFLRTEYDCLSRSGKGTKSILRLLQDKIVVRHDFLIGA